jgi:hypothetical protein
MLAAVRAVVHMRGLSIGLESALDAPESGVPA